MGTNLAASREQHEELSRGPAPPRLPTTLLWVLGGVLAAVLIVGAVVGALRGPVETEPGTPEATIQGYLQAVFDGDYGEARGFLDQGTAEGCGSSDFRHAWVPGEMTAALDDVRASGDEAEIDVQLSSSAGRGPFGDGGYTSTETFELVRENGEWRITGQFWPVYECGGAP